MSINENRSSASTEVYRKEIRTEGSTNESVEEAAARARQLQAEGKGLLNQTAEDVRKAEMAQKAAAAMAAQANRQTEEALNKQIAGQEKLACAGAKMMEAGAKLQQEAATGAYAEVPFNVHGTEQIRQKTETRGTAVQDIRQDMHVIRETESSRQTECGRQCR